MAKHPHNAFDATDPFDAAAEDVRRRVMDALIAAIEGDPLALLGQAEAVSALLAGAMTALVGTMFVLTTEDARDEVMQLISDAMPGARLQAEAIIKGVIHG